MAALVTEKWSGKGYSQVEQGWQAERYFAVSGINPGDEPAALAAVYGYDGTSFNTVHPRNAAILCNNIGVQQWDGPGFATVRASYALPPMGQFNQPNENPLLAPLRVSWQRALKSEATDVTTGNYAIVNSAGDPFDPSPQREVITRVLVLKRYEPFFDIMKAESFENHVNDAAGTIGPLAIAKYQCKCLSIEPTQEYQAGAPYMEIAYQFEIDTSNDDPFQIRQVDMGGNGFCVIPTGWPGAGTTVKGPFVNKRGEPLNSQIRLDGTGKPLASSDQIMVRFAQDGENDPNKIPPDIGVASPVGNPSLPSYEKPIVSMTGCKVIVFSRCKTATFSGLGL